MKLDCIPRIKVLIERRDILNGYLRDLYSARGMIIVNSYKNDIQVEEEFVSLFRDTCYKAVKAEIAEIDEELKIL